MEEVQALFFVACFRMFLMCCITFFISSASTQALFFSRGTCICRCANTVFLGSNYGLIISYVVT